MGKYVIFGVCFLAASIGSAVILTNGMVKFKKASAEVINVTGSADMGVFQITPVNSTEVSDWGSNDTSSLEKKVFAVVHADFAITE